mmetsp:Transcript_11163/g.21589  ORF Transcript_11163/g.21589 Transcript_11163/m.21589 type:complete len:150 (+) Transcript_11163:2837-3286(+)
MGAKRTKMQPAHHPSNQKGTCIPFVFVQAGINAGSIIPSLCQCCVWLCSGTCADSMSICALVFSSFHCLIQSKKRQKKRGNPEKVGKLGKGEMHDLSMTPLIAPTLSEKTMPAAGRTIYFVLVLRTAYLFVVDRPAESFDFIHPPTVHF